MKDMTNSEWLDVLGFLSYDNILSAVNVVIGATDCDRQVAEDFVDRVRTEVQYPAIRKEEELDKVKAELEQCRRDLNNVRDEFQRCGEDYSLYERRAYLWQTLVEKMVEEEWIR